MARSQVSELDYFAAAHDIFERYPMTMTSSKTVTSNDINCFEHELEIEVPVVKPLLHQGKGSKEIIFPLHGGGTMFHNTLTYRSMSCVRYCCCWLLVKAGGD